VRYARPGQPARLNPTHQPGEQDPKRPEETKPSSPEGAAVPVSSGPNSVFTTPTSRTRRSHSQKPGRY
jgi:hypothetical protein